MKTITPEELKTQIENNNQGRLYVLIDVREKGERDAAMVSGTLHIPLREIQERVDEFAMYDDIYIHCHSGGRSQQACEDLKHVGLHNVVNVDGGILGMQRAGFKIE